MYRAREFIFLLGTISTTGVLSTSVLVLGFFCVYVCVVGKGGRDDEETGKQKRGGALGACA